MKIDLVKTNATKRIIDVSPKLNFSGIFSSRLNIILYIKIKVFIVAVLFRFC